MTVWEELSARGLVAQTTGDDTVRNLVNEGKAVFYIGFDPTADSLHVGHFLPLILMRHLQRAGNRPIALIGGGTTMVGDPSGRTDLRQMMTAERIGANAEKFKGQIGRFIDFSEDRAVMVNNADWLMGLNYIEFLRDVGVHFSVNRMLAADCFKSRMERGLNFLEFNYMLMQGYDFLCLHDRYGCNLQCGGADQWSNILAGTELIRRKRTHDAHGLTITLLLTAEGIKMGKTAKGAVWLDPEKTSPFEFFQYFRNVADADVIPFLKKLTFLSLEEIDAMAAWEGAQLNTAKERLAFALTSLVHGDREAAQAREAARALFGGGGDAGDMPTTALSKARFADGAISVLDLLVACKLAASKGDARRLVEQGGVEVNGRKADSFGVSYTEEQVRGGLVVKKGKKTFHRVRLSS
ncbi:MAG: tyrosine--tRNA ligase [Oscillospiraceae bacterium]|jgi:tyrosyl-tRNA synthetase|nr:tyrosine--tRNA ligase [Oscillospiraceae bacterium]